MKFQNEDKKNMTILMVPNRNDFEKNEKKKGAGSFKDYNAHSPHQYMVQQQNKMRECRVSKRLRGFLATKWANMR